MISTNRIINQHQIANVTPNDDTVYCMDRGEENKKNGLKMLNFDIGTGGVAGVGVGGYYYSTIATPRPAIENNVLVPSVPEEFLCSLTFTVMEDPLMTRSGLNFERSAILNWLDTKKGESACPVTGEQLRPSMLVSNAALRVRIEKWRHEFESAKEELKKKNNQQQQQQDDDCKNRKTCCYDYDGLEEKMDDTDFLLMEIENLYNSSKDKKDQEGDDHNSWCWDADSNLTSPCYKKKHFFFSNKDED